MSHDGSGGVSPLDPVSARADPGRSSRCGWRGRSREWEVLAGLLRAAEGGRGGVLLVEGRSGMGKSRLLSEAVELAAGRGFVLSRGTADESGQLAPLKPLMSALGESPRTLRGSLGREPSDQRLWLVEQLQARLEERAARGPHLVTVDDLQWADPTTLLALRSLVPELASYPLVWMLSQTTGGGSGVDRLYDVLERDGATRMTLEGLDDQAVTEVIVDTLGAPADPELRELAAGTAGNPFMLVELLQGLLDEGAVEVTAGHARLVSRQLPRRVQENARRRLGRLSPRTRQLLQVAAILGRSFDADDLAQMLGEPPSRLLPALEEAEAAGVVVTDAGLPAFRHDLLWRAVTETVTPSVRQALHRQAGQMLLRRDGSAVPAAAHLLHSARPGDTTALEGLDRAVREVLPSSPQTAADLAVRALEITAPSAPGHVDRTVTAVHALTTAGRLAEAVDLARAALVRDAAPGQAAHLRAELAYALYLAGRPVEAVAEAEKALGRPDLPDEPRGLAEQMLFQGPLGSHDYQRGEARAQPVVADPARHSRAAVIGAHMLLADIAWAKGRAADGIEHGREAVRIAADEPVHARRVHPRLLLATALTDMRRLDEAEAVLQAATEEITARGHTAYAAGPCVFRARLRLAEGRLDDAAAEAETGLAMADEMGMHLFDPMGIIVLAIVALHRGDIDAGARHAGRCQSQDQAGHGPMHAWGWATWAMARIAEAQGDRTRAIEVLHAVFDDPSERLWLLMAEPDAAAWLIRTALVADRSGAEAIAGTAEDLSRRNPAFPTLAASAAQAYGILHEDAAALAYAAATHGGPWSRASAAEDLGVLLARRDGESGDDTVHRLDEALDGYQRIGALRDAARIRARLRGLGVRRPHWSRSERPVSGWASLTDTERSVAGLVAHGLTNPQVAGQMFISPHTVKFHLRQVFRKLGVASRVELARLAVEHPHDTPAG